MEDGRNWVIFTGCMDGDHISVSSKDDADADNVIRRMNSARIICYDAINALRQPFGYMAPKFKARTPEKPGLNSITVRATVHLHWPSSSTFDGGIN